MNDEEEAENAMERLSDEAFQMTPPRTEDVKRNLLRLWTEAWLKPERWTTEPAALKMMERLMSAETLHAPRRFLQR